MELLRKKDLYEKVKIPKSTVADWIEDFSVYIPKSKQGNVTYYRPEAIDVLLFIKQCREQNYQKQQIFGLLAKKGFPITVEEALEDVQNALNTSENYRDTLLTIMQTTGQAVIKIADQEQSIVALQEKENEQDGTLKTLQQQQVYQNEQLEFIGKRTGETDEIINHLKQEIKALKEEIAITKESKEKVAAEKQKKWWELWK